MASDFHSQFLCQHVVLLAQSAVAYGHLPAFAPRTWPRLRFGPNEFTECLCQLACGSDSNPKTMRQKAHTHMLLAVGNRENYRNVVLTTADLREAYRQMGCPAVPWSSWDYIDRKAHLALAAKVGAQVGGDASGCMAKRARTSRTRSCNPSRVRVVRDAGGRGDHASRVVRDDGDVRYRDDHASRLVGNREVSAPVATMEHVVPDGPDGKQRSKESKLSGGSRTVHALKRMVRYWRQKAKQLIKSLEQVQKELHDRTACAACAMIQ